jgi:DNA-binding XRE family transcriptional regulator
MTEKKRSPDAVEWAYNRYIKGDPEMEAYLEDLDVQSALAQQIYDIRNRLRMTREDLAEFSGLTPEAIENLEETDYDGDWNEAIERINHAFRHWFTNVIIPAAQMTPDDYSVKAVNA